MSNPTPHGRALPGNQWDLLDGVTPEALPTVSVIVAHFNQPQQLRRTLWALARQDYPGELVEIIVVDDGSAVAPDVPEGILLVRQDDDGFRLAASRNLGAAAAANDVLVFLDADTSPEPGYLRELTRLPALSDDAVTVGRRRHADLAQAEAFADIETVGAENELEEPRWLVDAYRDSRNLLDADYRSYRYLIGAVLACSREFFFEIGPFDESFTEYGGEDWEWAYRAWLAGAAFAHVPEAVAWHDGPYRSDRASDLATKNDEALRLADLIPVPGSRGRALPSNHADIAVYGPPESATRGQIFVSHDSLLGELPGGERADVSAVDDDRSGGDGAGDADATDRFDRVRIEVRVALPVRAEPGSLAPALSAISGDDYAEVIVRSSSGTELLRLVSRRALARQQRWGGEPLLPTLDLVAEGVAELTDEVDLEAYLGGWG